MRIRTRTFILIFSSGLQKVTTLLLQLILARLIFPELLGTYRQVFLAYTLLLGVLSLQLENSLFYFLPKLGADHRRPLLTQTSVLGLTLAALVGLVMFFGAQFIANFLNNPSLAPLIRIMALYPLPEAMNVLVPPFMVSLDRTVAASVYTLALNVGKIAVTVVLVALHFDLTMVMWGTVLSSAVVAAISWTHMYRLSEGGPARLDRNLILEQLHYCWPLWITVVIGTITGLFDQLLISKFFDARMFATYTNGAYELPVIALITTNLAVAIMPNLVVLADQGKTLDALDLWQEAARKCSLVIFPCFVFFLVVAPDFMSVLWGRQYVIATWPYSMSAWTFMIYLLILPTRIVIFGSIFRALGKTKPYAFSALLGLTTDVIVGTALAWGGHGGFLSYVGPTLAVVCSSAVMLTYSLLKLGQIVDLPVRKLVRWKELGRIMLLCALCGGLILALPLSFLPTLVKLLVQATVFALAIIALFFGTKTLHPDEKDLLFMPWRIVSRLGKGGQT
jgi:O-antigen/teichoic acid export membrane protein